MKMVRHDSQFDSVMQSLYGWHAIAWGDSLGGFSSENVAFEANQQLYVLKKYGKAAQQQLNRIEQVALFLKQHHFPAPAPLLTSTQAYHFLFQADVYAVFPRYVGSILHQETLTKTALEQTAIKLGQLHRLGPAGKDLLSSRSHRALTNRYATQQNIDAMTSSIVKKELPSQWCTILQESLRFKQQIANTLQLSVLDDVKSGDDFVHGDFHNQNILFDENHHISCVMDYEESMLGCGFLDVFHFVMLACCNSDFSPHALANARHFITVYQDTHGLPKEAVKRGLDSFFLFMAKSYFFETKVLHQEAFFLDLIQRDSRKMSYFLVNRRNLIDALTP